MKTQRINDWTLLAEDKDEPMVKHASRYDCTPNFDAWHANLMGDIGDMYMDPECEYRSVLDVGSSYGWMAIPFSQKFKQVYSFEARADLAECQSKNLDHCNIDNVTIYNKAVSSYEGLAHFTEMENSGSSHISYEEYNTTIPTMTIDSLGLTDVDLIKIDVEGHEYDVLKGAVETIKRTLPTLILEMHSITGRTEKNFINRQEILCLLEDFGYKIIDIRKNDIIFTTKKHRVRHKLAKLKKDFSILHED